MSGEKTPAQRAQRVLDIAVEKTPAQRVLDIAVKIAHDAPRKRGQYVSSALVYWPDIIELREALEELGVEWK